MCTHTHTHRPTPQQVQPTPYGGTQMGGSYIPPAYGMQQPYSSLYQPKGGAHGGEGSGASGIIGTGGFQPKQEKMDPGYECKCTCVCVCVFLESLPNKEDGRERVHCTVSQ